MKIVLLLTLVNCVSLSHGARILAFIPTPSYSHQLVYRPLWRALSLRGHQITLLTTDPENKENLTNLIEIDLHSTYDVWNKHIPNIVNAGGNIYEAFKIYVDLLYELVDVQMTNPSVVKLINDRTQKFDLVIVESLTAVTAVFSRKYNCPVIAVSIAPLLEYFYQFIGVPTHPVLYPDPFLAFDKTETLLERVISVTFHVFVNFLVLPYLDQIQDQVIEKYFGKEFGSAKEIVGNVSMLFINENQIIDGPRAMVPGVIYVRGIHNEPLKPLPEDLKTTLDLAGEGFIYFSLGTNVKSEDISPKTRQIMLEAFSELPYKVLWKFELDNVENMPVNVVIAKWFPQNDVLRHTNIKLFITHGGLASLEEAISARVPMLAIPFFGDQIRNVKKMVRKGIALYLDIAELDKNYFKSTILEVIQNPKYRIAIEELANLVEDQPMTSLDQAVWWTEYVIRHKGASHLRSPLVDIPWYQYLLLDVVVCLFLALLLCLFLIIAFLRTIVYLLKKLFASKNKEKKL